jgi:hypothetical protein
MEISRFPSKRLLRMPGSTTTRGQHVSCDIDTGCVAFCWTENISAPDLSYAAQYLACALPCERFASALASNPCITRGAVSLVTECRRDTLGRMWRALDVDQNASSMPIGSIVTVRFDPCLPKT